MEEHLIPSILLIPDFQIAAFSTTDPTKRNRLQQQHEAKHYEDWQQLVSDNTIDAIIVAGPPRFNADVVDASIRNGKPVFSEKPCANEMTRLLELVELSKKENGSAQIGFNFRHSRYFSNLMRLEERFGEPISLDIEYSTNKPLAPLWDYGSVLKSFLFAVGIHPLDILCAFLSSKFNYQSHISRLKNDRFQIRILAHNNSRAVTLLTGNYSPRFFASFKATYENSVMAVSNSDQPSLIHVFSNDSGKSSEPDRVSMPNEYTVSHKSLQTDREGSGYQAEMLIFRDLIVDKKPNKFSLEHSVEVFKIIEQLSGDE